MAFLASMPVLADQLLQVLIKQRVMQVTAGEACQQVLQISVNDCPLLDVVAGGKHKCDGIHAIHCMQYTTAN